MAGEAHIRPQNLHVLRRLHALGPLSSRRRTRDTRRVPRPGRPASRVVRTPDDAVTAGRGRWGERLDELLVSVTYPAADLALVGAAGEIDRRTSPRWARTLAEACAALTLLAGAPPAGSHSRPGDRLHGRGPATARRMVCDLSEVTLLDAAGLGVLVELAGLAARGRIELRLVVATRPVRRVLELTGLDREFRVERRLLDALDTSASPA